VVTCPQAVLAVLARVTSLYFISVSNDMRSRSPRRPCFGSLGKALWVNQPRWCVPSPSSLRTRRLVMPSVEHEFKCTVPASEAVKTSSHPLQAYIYRTYGSSSELFTVAKTIGSSLGHSCQWQPVLGDMSCPTLGILIGHMVVPLKAGMTAAGFRCFGDTASPGGHYHFLLGMLSY